MLGTGKLSGRQSGTIKITRLSAVAKTDILTHHSSLINTRKAIVKEVRKSIVYPNKAFMPTSLKNPMSFRRFEPIAIMAVKVDSGSDLPRKGERP